MLTSGCSALSDDDYKAALASFEGRYEHRDRALFVLGSRTGFRISELLSLTLVDVWDEGADQVRPTIQIRRQYMKGKKRSRTLPLHSEACEALELWIRAARLTDLRIQKAYLFSGQKSIDRAMARQSADRIIRTAYRRAGLRSQGTHSMRKTFASRIWNCGLVKGDIFKMREILGHDNLNNTARYIQFLDGTLEEAIMA